MDLVKRLFTRENGRIAAGGGPLRPVIHYLLGGKDWWQSFTAMGLIIWTGATPAVRAICGAELLAPETCGALLKYLIITGQILTALGIRRGGKS